MTDIQFNEEQEFARPTTMPRQSKLVRLALATGFVKTKQHAEYLLLGIAGMCVLVTFFILFSGGKDKPTSPAFKEGQNVLMPPSAVTPQP